MATKKQTGTVEGWDPEGTHKESEPNPADVAQARRLRAAGKKDPDIAKEMNVREDTVARWLEND